MKKLFFCMAAAALSCGMMQAETIAVNSEVTDTIKISAAGTYTLEGDGTRCKMPVVVNADIADTVFVTAKNANIVPEANGSAMNIGANSVVVLNVKGANAFKGGKNGCGIEAAGDLIINATVADTLDGKGAGRSAAIGTTKDTPAGGNITINGGVIYAQSGSESAAIGASNAGRLGNITINGGQIHAVGGAYSSAIGAAYCSTGASVITINGGMVEAKAGSYCSNRSIGKGNKSHRGTVNIVVMGGSIMAKGSKGEMDGVIEEATNGTEAVMPLVLTLPEASSVLVTEGYVGNVTLGADYGIKDVYTDAEGKLYFYLPENAKDAEAVINGVKVQEGEAPSTPDKPDQPNQPSDTTTILVNSTVTKTVNIAAAGTYILQGDGTVCTFPVIVATNLGDINIILDGVTVEVTGAKDAGVSAMLVGEGTNATIAFKGFNSLKSTCDPGCGLEAKGNVILNGEDNAELHCTAKGWAAAIGSTPRPKSKVMASGDITINSGMIYANAEWESPAIGAAVDCDAHNITINGGQIEAKGGAQGAGIGTGYSQWGQSKGKGTITINGGTIVAAAGTNESSWGADDGLVPLGVVKGDKASINVVVTGGSVKACRSDMSDFQAPIAAKDAAGTDLTLFKAHMQGATEPMLITEGHIGDIVLGTNYGIKDVYTDAAGYVYFYLPAQPADVEVVLNGKKPENPGMAIDEVMDNATAPVKVMYNGVLYIVRDGVIYTVTGAVVH